MHKYDYDLVRQSVSMEMVLARYNITLKRVNGTMLRGACPLQTGHGKDAFNVWTERNGWKCHSCGKKGNVMAFVREMEKLATDWEAAKLLYNWFGLGNGHAKPDVQPVEQHAEQHDEPLVNPPLKFALKAVDPNHPYLLSRGFDPAHALYLDAGYFPGKGSMTGRFVFPIHDADGQLLAYSGRVVDDSLITDENPRWKLPAGFHKSLVLYNLHRVLRGEFDSVIVCESFWSVMACVRAGAMNSVALMGKSLSDAQAELLKQFRRITLLLDGDDAGRKASAEVGAKLLTLGGQDSIQVLYLPSDHWNQPDKMPAEELQTLVL